MGFVRSSAALSAVALAVFAAVAMPMASGDEAPHPLYESMRADLPPVENAIFGLPYLDNAALRTEADERAANRTDPTPLRFGVEQPLNETDIMAEGEVVQIPCPSAPSNETCRDKVVRYIIVSKGAVAMQLTFSKMVLCSTCQVLVYPADEALADENTIAFTNSLHGRAPPRPDFVAQTPLLPGDSLVVEVYVSSGEQVEVIASEVVHSFRELFDMMVDSQKVFGDSPTQYCENNANCYGDWAWEKKAVALITAGGGYCSGSLLNNAFGSRQVFLTASHCLEYNTNSGSGWIPSSTLNSMGFYFNGDTYGCYTNNGPSPSSLDYVSGAWKLSSKSYKGGMDFALLKIKQTIPSSFGVYYLGWDKSYSLPNTAVGIHHPGADFKKTSFGTTKGIGGYGGAYNQIKVKWYSGTTAGGSSGSPLLHYNTKRVIGQLRGGSASCENPNGKDYYGRLALSFNNGMKPHLAGSASSITYMGGTFNPTEYPCAISNSCGGYAGSEWGCFCDNYCTSYNDCCSDYWAYCA